MIQFKITENFMKMAGEALFITSIVGIPLFFISKCTYNNVYPSEQILREQILEDSIERANDSMDNVLKQKRVLFVDTSSKTVLKTFGVDVKTIKCVGGYNGYNDSYICRFTKSYDLGKLYSVECTERSKNVLVDCDPSTIADLSESIKGVQQLPDPVTHQVDSNAVQN